MPCLLFAFTSHHTFANRFWVLYNSPAKDGHASKTVCGRRPCSTAGHEAGCDHGLTDTAVIHRVGSKSGWEQPSIQRSCGGEMIRIECCSICLWRLGDLLCWYSPPAILFSMLLVLCPVERFYLLASFWEKSYHNATDFLLGGIVLGHRPRCSIFLGWWHSM
jgi:hypothetical protein